MTDSARSGQVLCYGELGTDGAEQLQLRAGARHRGELEVGSEGGELLRRGLVRVAETG